MKHTKGALMWIVSILNKHKVKFQITGGLAAELYGSRRSLADIDIDIHERNFSDILSSVKKYIIFGPAKYHDKHWNLLLMTLKYKGQLIDICGLEHTKIFDHKKKKWILLKSNLSKTKIKIFHGIKVPVELESELITYKKELSRRVDLIDIKQMK